MSHYSNFQKEVVHLSESASVKLTSLRYDKHGLFHLETKPDRIRSTSIDADIVSIPLLKFFSFKIKQFLNRF